MIARLLPFALVFGLALTPALATDDKRAAELDQLFAKLHTPDEGEEAFTTQSRIWSNWMQSGSITHDLILQQATMAMAAEEYYTSEKMLSTLIERRPDYAEAYDKRAVLYFIMGRLDSALADTGKALDLEPRHFGALTGRGLILQQLGRDEEALAAYREALAINPHLGGVEAAVKLMEKAKPGI